MPEERYIAVPEKSLLRVFLLTAVFVMGLLIVGQFAGAVATPLVLILLAVVLVMGLNPVVARLESRLHIPRRIAAPLVMFGLLIGLGVFFAFALPPFLAQGMKFAESVPQLIRNVEQSVDGLANRYRVLQPLLSGGAHLDLQSFFSSASVQNLMGVGINVAGLLAYSVLVFVLMMFLLINPDPIIRGLMSGIAPRYRGSVETTLVRIGSQLGSWLVGVLLASVIVGTLIGIGLHFIGFKNSLLFGMVAGLTNVIPFVGPWLGVCLPVMVAASSGAWSLALGAILVMVVVQQIDSHLLSPFIFGRMVQLHPASLLISGLLLGSLWGAVGIFLATPLTIIAKAIYEELYLARLHRPEVKQETVATVVAAGQSKPPTEPETLPAGKLPSIDASR